MAELAPIRFEVPGERRRISRIVSAKTAAPPSGSSSRLTLVTTA